MAHEAQGQGPVRQRRRTDWALDALEARQLLSTTELAAPPVAPAAQVAPVPAESNAVAPPLVVEKKPDALGVGAPDKARDPALDPNVVAGPIDPMLVDPKRVKAEDVLRPTDPPSTVPVVMNVTAPASETTTGPVLLRSLSAPVTIKEGGLLTVATAAATIEPVVGATFAFEGTPPTDAGINPSTGLISWMATEGPAQATFLVKATTKDGDIDRETLSVKVENVPPEVRVGDVVRVAVGAPFTRLATVKDVGNDVESVVVDYGDGSTLVQGALESRTLPLAHVYQKVGEHQLKVTATDKDGAVGTATAPVFVTDGSTPVTPTPGGTTTPLPVVPDEAVAPKLRGARLDMSGQYSRRGAIVMTFDQRVTLGKKAIEVGDRLRRPIKVQVATRMAIDGGTIATVTPKGQNSFLTNGPPRMVVHGDKVVARDGTQADLDRDGDPGGDFSRTFRAPNRGGLV